MNMQSNTTFSQAISQEAIRSYVQRVYAWMVGGLLLTTASAALVASSETLQAAIFGTPLVWVVMLAP
jgi:FtsH-binding integral membrane protein